MSLPLVVQYKLPWLSESFHPYREIPSWKGKYPVFKTNTKPHQLIRHARTFYSIVSLVFHKFLCSTYRNGLNRGTSKSTNPVSLVSIVGNLHFSIILHRVRYLKMYLCLKDNRSSIYRVSLTSKTKDAPP